jgi:hypothetical protein
MHRIAAAMLIAATVLAFNGSMLRDAFAGEPAVKVPAASAEITQPATIRNAKVLSLLMILESLRQAPVLLDPQKV